MKSTSIQYIHKYKDVNKHIHNTQTKKGPEQN